MLITKKDMGYCKKAIICMKKTGRYFLYTNKAIILQLLIVINLNV